MRIALISDIHGNLGSLDAVLADVKQEQVDRLICLGDVATLGPQPREVIARLRELDCQFITGNHETDVLNVGEMEQEQAHVPLVTEAVKWCAQQFSESERNFLRSFHPTLTVPLDAEVTLLCFHGFPQTNTDIIRAATPYDESEGFFAGQTATILAGGHTHVQMLRRYNKQLIVNPVSVGEPLAEGRLSVLPWAEYAIIGSERGKIQIDLRRVPVDVHAIHQACTGTMNPLNWSSLWISLDQL